MRCSKCGSDNREGRKFCAQCGASMAPKCARCGASNDPGEKFCGECGNPLAASPSPAPSTTTVAAVIRVAPASGSEHAIDGERKTVTALFADIKGSTELEQDLDPEDARAIVDPALKLMIDAAHRYDGYVVQSTGDGIFALFGAPVAHEDHPQRALYAALRMQEESRRYGSKLQAEGLAPIEIRIGVNTGEVVVRSIHTGDRHVEYTPIGHTTNLASRLQSIARTGSIVASEATRKFCEGYFILKPSGATKVKGVSEPLTVYEVTGLGPLRTRLQRSAGRGLTKFVGRSREMESLKRAAEQAKAGHGQIVAAMAEPGVGKSRLFYEFKARNQSGWMMVEALSVSHGKASAYFPVIDLLHSYFEISSDDDARKRRERVAGKIVILDRGLEDALPYLYGLLGIVEEPNPLAQMDAQIRNRRTLDAIKRFLLRESVNQPLMVIFEDLHWIDDETQALLNLLADSIGTAKVLLLVNYRPEYSHQWGSKTYYTQLRLDPLGKESAEEMLSSLLGDDKDLIPLKRLIIERTEGNPFFMEETVQVMFEEGALVRNGGIKLVKPLAELKIPPTVQAILASRIDRLPSDQKDLLQTLAVIGMEFTFGLLQPVVAKSEDEINRMLHELQLAEFVYEQPAAGDTQYIFKHAQTREVAYNSVLNERRKLLHERIGSTMEALFTLSIDDHLSQLAHHYARSSNIEKAVEYLDRAGRRAAIRGALKEAEIHFKQAIAVLSTTPETPGRVQREFNLQLSLLAMLTNTSDLAADDTALGVKRLRELGEKIGNPDHLIFMLSLAWFPVLGRGDLTAAQQIADQMLEIAERNRSNLYLTVAHSVQAYSRMMRGHLTQAMQHCEAVIASYNESDFSGFPSDPKVSALSFVGLLWWQFGMADRGRASIREAISLSERLKKPADVASALAAASHLYISLRDPGNVREFAERLFTLASEQQLPGQLVLGSVFRGWAIAEQGRTDEGIALIRSGLDSSESRLNRPQFLADLSEAQARAGQLEEALATIEQAFSAVGEVQVHLPRVLWWRGDLHLRRGDETLADRDFREAIAVARRIGSRAYELCATTSLARLLAKRGKRDEARAMLAEIYGWFTEGFDTADLKDAKALLDSLNK